MSDRASGSSHNPSSHIDIPGSVPRSYSTRRPSYATIAAGTAPTSQSSRTNPQPIAPPPQERHLLESTMDHSRRSSRGMDTEAQGSNGATTRSGNWRPDGKGFGRRGEPSPFLIPSYLRHSRHVQRLRRAHEEREDELRDQAQSQALKQTSLSRSSSNATLSKMHSVHYHRPAIQDVVERLPPPTEDDKLHSLPSRWNEDDMQSGLEILADGTEVRFGGVTKTSDEAASIRSDHPMPKECGLYYFEVTVLSRSKDGLIGIGFSSKKANLNRLPGWEADSSWAYHGDDGYCFACTSNGKPYGPRFSSQDIIGCGVNFRTGDAFFTKNGHYLGVAFTSVKADKLYPSVGMKKPGEHLRINFGRTPFVFDIDRMMERERQSILAEINEADVGNLHAPDDERGLIHKLIGQYLMHEGYVETAKVFAKDVFDERLSFSPGHLAPELPTTDDDIHAINRQKIRRSILDGDIDRALKYTNTYYPRVLEEERNKDVYFRLKCRKFIEMMRRHSELATTTTSPALSKSVDSLESNGHVEEEAEYSNGNLPIDTQMELDEQINREARGVAEPPSDDVDMDASHDSLPKAAFMKGTELLTSALGYGQELQHEFGGDPRPHVKKQLNDLFALVAYPTLVDSPVAYLLETKGRAEIAEEVNGAILVSLGKPSSAALEKLTAQTEALLDETATKASGAAAFINVRKDFLQ